MVIFHSYVSLPEGKTCEFPGPYKKSLGIQPESMEIISHRGGDWGMKNQKAVISQCSKNGLGFTNQQHSNELWPIYRWI